MKSPFFKISIGDLDLTDFVESFKYDDNSEKDSMIEVQVRRRDAVALADDGSLARGKQVKFYFGYLGGKQSSVHLAEVTDVDMKYDGNGTSLTIRALDRGNAMKKTSSKKVWNGLTTSEIAESIAQSHSLVYEGEKTSKKWESLPQGNKSDFEFLQYLAMREDGGDYICYVSNDRLVLEKRKTSEASVLTFEYLGENGFVSFSPKERESTGDGSLSKASVDTPDGKTGTSVTKTPETADGHTSLGEKIYKYSGETGERLGVEAVKSLPVVADGKEEAGNIANSLSKKSSLEQMTASMSIEGNPSLRPNQVITVKGVARRHQGNWLIKAVSHSLTGSGYTSGLELVKNGSDLSGGKSASKNRTVGPNEKKTSKAVAVKVYDSEGQEVKDPAVLATRQKNIDNGG